MISATSTYVYWSPDSRVSLHYSLAWAGHSKAIATSVSTPGLAGSSQQRVRWYCTCHMSRAKSGHRLILPVSEFGTLNKLILRWLAV